MMKRIYTSLLAIIIASTTLFAQIPNWASKAAKSVFKLTTFKQDGSLLTSVNGFFIGTNGEAISSFTPFKGASSAVIVDSNGKKYNVACMLGANDIYDIAKFRVEGTKSQPLTVANTAAEKGSTIWLLPYSIKNPDCQQGTVSKSESFLSNYNYYTLDLKANENCISCPIMNQSGEVIGILQPSADGISKETYAVSASFAASQNITGLSINDNTLNSTFISKDLPDDKDQAIVTLYIAQQKGADEFKQVIEKFINKFPNVADGYISRAQLEADQDNFISAKSDMEKALKVADKKDDVHYSYSKLIYQKEIYKSDKPYKDWNLDLAYNEAKKAYDINSTPMYKYQMAQILYSQKKYQDAYNTYIELTKTPLKNAEIFYEAAQSKIQLQASDTVICALLDSAVNCFTKPYTRDAAPYILARATKLDNMKKYREAVNDYNDYETLMRSSINDSFYYIREQAELNARLYKQALDDISKAIELNPKEATYYAEQANLMLRVNMLEDALNSAKKCVDMAPKYSDGYLILGLIQVKKGNKEDGMQNLQKAKSLGNTQADSVIEKYK
ncbi:tetratricopeptide repeat protein [Xylanibacter oryzae]|uniref:tetratricopeptide repeat protein n=1 Tax=Xylanibacter oryzae TaxID=185293 RepID=UPI000687D0BE|nr:tetratricopeptide repeat protein [Xylanibacter oryzae]